jgi:hypothetical protein
VIFYSYVKLPEGKSHIFAVNPMIYWWIHHDPVIKNWSPAGESRDFEIENGHRHSEFFPLKKVDLSRVFCMFTRGYRIHFMTFN